MTNEEDKNSDTPLLHLELEREQFDRVARESMPENLQAINSLPSFPSYQHVTLDRRALDMVSTEPVQPYLPPWVGVSRRPQLATFPWSMK